MGPPPGQNITYTESGSHNGELDVKTANRGAVRRLGATTTRSMAPLAAAVMTTSEYSRRQGMK